MSNETRGSIADRESLASVPAAIRPALSGQSGHSGPSGERTLDERLDQVYRSRKVFSLWLLPPLAFFVFLVAWFREGWILIAVGGAIYAYMLAQFFIFQNPARRARKAGDAHDRTATDPHPTQETDAPA